MVAIGKEKGRKTRRSGSLVIDGNNGNEQWISSIGLSVINELPKEPLGFLVPSPCRAIALRVEFHCKPPFNMESFLKTLPQDVHELRPAGANNRQGETSTSMVHIRIGEESLGNGLSLIGAFPSG